VPLDQIGKAEIRMEDPILRRRDRLPTITVRGDIGEEFQPPDVSTQVMQALKPIMDRPCRPATGSRWARTSRKPARPMRPWRRSSR
jgi:multidrug efflux pump subunit AcrB